MTTTAEMTDIVERLLARRINVPAPTPFFSTREFDPDCKEAADTITALRARVAELEGKNKRMREALALTYARDGFLVSAFEARSILSSTEDEK